MRKKVVRFFVWAQIISLWRRLVKTVLLELKYSNIFNLIPINKRLSDFRPATLVKI